MCSPTLSWWHTNSYLFGNNYCTFIFLEDWNTKQQLNSLNYFCAPANEYSVLPYFIGHWLVNLFAIIYRLTLKMMSYWHRLDLSFNTYIWMLSAFIYFSFLLKDVLNYVNEAPQTGVFKNDWVTLWVPKVLFHHFNACYLFK